MTILCFVCFVSSFGFEKGVSIPDKYPIIPTPQKIIYGNNEVKFRAVFIIANEFVKEGEKLTAFFSNKGVRLNNKGIKLELLKRDLDSAFNEEGYQLIITDKITIAAPNEKGVFYAIQTLKQIFRKNKELGVFPEISISDWPAFKIRGFMHDTGRNFQSVSQLKEQIEVLSQYKYNVFHWHLTDNPAWRLESNKYPELQSENVTTRQKGKFYTQDDFKEILAFCKARHIVVIPEFDIPGHTEAFRKAFNIKSMQDYKVKAILLDLFEELMSLADAVEMPYIHIGTDEVRIKEERLSSAVILAVMDLIRDHNREVIVWKEGVEIKEDKNSINQLWAYHKGREGHRFIDSRSNYINHLDPFAGMSRLYFQQPCRQSKGDKVALGGVLCAWPDNNITKERDILIQNPIYPSIVFYADAIWKGRAKDFPEYWAKLPPKDSDEFKAFKNFESKVITHRNEFFKGKEFQYVAQTGIHWKLIGPFVHNENLAKKFPVEEIIKEYYTVNSTGFKWTDTHTGGTIHLKHFFGFPSVTEAKKGTYYAYTNIYSPNNRVQDFWIGFHGWSRSGGRRGGPTPALGQWHTTNPKIWVNSKEIKPPLWKQPDIATDTDDIPFIDEDYFFRKPTRIPLKKGWNKVLLKIPQGGNSWKWMFTCIPINSNENGVREVKEIKFNTNFNPTNEPNYRVNRNETN